nr:outer membrane beta-barrel protein [Sphingomonas sp.]
MIYFTAAAAALAFAAPAMAQGAAAPAAPAGFRIELLAGYDHAGTDGFHKDGVLFGAGAGYDLAVAHTVSLGVDAEITGATGNKDGVKAGRDLYAGGRISFAVAPKADLYVKGGYTNGRITEEGFGGENLDGWRVGVGGQLLVGGGSYVGLEYRYSNYEQNVDRHQAAVTVGHRF